MALSVRGVASLFVRVPTALFPIALGLSGLGSLFLVANGHVALSGLRATGIPILVLSAIVLLVDILCYTIKLARNRDEVLDDWDHPTRANLLAPGFMAAMVIGGTLTQFFPAGWILWAGASAGHFLLLVGFVGRWLSHEYAPDDLNPTWFLPAAGLMTSPMTWPGHGPIIIPTMLLGIGAFLWIMLLPLVFRRLVFEPAVAPELRPTLFILAAPFGLFAGALMTLFPQSTSALVVAALSGGTLFILVLVTQWKFLSQAGVTLSWWAATFPVSTVAIGFLRSDPAGDHTSLPTLVGLALGSLACLTSLIAIIATFRAASRTCNRTVMHTEREIEAMQGQN